MSFKKNQRAFTIVELLVVIVVIGILASISVVSYNGVQNKARATKAQTNAAAVQRVAKAYYSRHNTYPTTVSHFTSSTTTLPPGVSLLTSGSLTQTNGENTVGYRYVGTAANATGACIYYWDFAPTTGNPRLSAVTRLGSATTSNCTTSVGNLPT